MLLCYYVNMRIYNICHGKMCVRRYIVTQLYPGCHIQTLSLVLCWHRLNAADSRHQPVTTLTLDWTALRQQQI